MIHGNEQLITYYCIRSRRPYQIANITETGNKKQNHNGHASKPQRIARLVLEPSVTFFPLMNPAPLPSPLTLSTCIFMLPSPLQIRLHLCRIYVLRPPESREGGGSCSFPAGVPIVVWGGCGGGGVDKIGRAHV